MHEQSMTALPDWTSADYWFADYIERLQKSQPRTIRLSREKVSIPVPEQEARAFTDKTEQLRRYLAGEREKSVA
ncbi:hypothetical protein F6W69_10530 [Microbacterium oxydans]|uniref:hypothetical protein n=1 Tax=Microbacterium oxydans TaxID=82380 RepID=UPI001144180D|nr:hypothetical protein [Microbacterium oxydans]KAB1891026.1 hypothetical protein F6W69_10530 [Microbacterium oxydans]GED39114.1 hypothetical protein MOX01_22560 [Microbacterium oxydans]